MSLKRQRFPSDPAHAALLRLLLAQDGSTTHVCEALSVHPVRMVLHQQLRTQDAPAAIREQLGGETWLARVSSLCCDSAVMMDNLSYTRLDAVPDWFLNSLEAGSAPIGRLLDRLFVRREHVDGSAEIAACLWDIVGLPDPGASRAYRIITPIGPLMLIFETYRAAMV